MSAPAKISSATSRGRLSGRDNIVRCAMATALAELDQRRSAPEIARSLWRLTMRSLWPW